MAYYLQLVVLTEQGRKRFDENPEWILEINKDIELMGAKMRAVGLERLSPLADVAVGGLLVGTVLTLIYIPMFAYSVEGKST